MTRHAIVVAVWSVLACGDDRGPRTPSHDAGVDACVPAEGPMGSPTCEGGVDDDCDGLVDADDPDCGCASPADCDDRMDCTADTCVAGECRYEPAPDGTACTGGCVMNGTCAAGECTGGEPLDADGDGDPLAPCGGTDCADGDPSRAGAFFEGPSGDALCGNGIDDDCDEGVDVLDVGCNPRVCREGWCWASPQPQGETLTDMAAIGTDGLVAVGTFGTILHWDGRVWSRAETGTTQDLAGVWVAGADDAWAVGASGTILRWNGAAWSSVASPVAVDLTDVSGVARDRAWAVGAGGTVLAWDGARWTASTPGAPSDLLAVEAVSASEVWASGDDGQLLRGSASGWSPEACGITGPILSLAPLDGGLVLGGEGGQLVRYDGTTFRPDTSLMGFASDVDDLFVVSATETFAISRGRILRWDGTTWDEEDLADPPVRVLASTRAGTLWGAGSGGRLAHRDADRWRGYSSHVSPHSGAGAWAVSGTEIWIGAGFDGIAAWDGTRFRYNPLPGTVGEEIAGVARDDVWVTGNESNLLHSDGAAWTETSTFTRTDFRAIWASAPGDAWAVAADASSSTFIRWNGTAWARDAAAPGIVALSGTADGQVWGVGGRTVRRWDGAAWTATMVAGVDDLRSVAAVAPDDVWAVGRAGGRGAIAHFDGMVWTVVRDDLASGLFSVAAGAADDVWASGDGGLLVHFDGGVAWSVEPSPSRMTFRHVRARDGSAWLASAGHLLYRTP